MLSESKIRHQRVRIGISIEKAFEFQILIAYGVE